MAIHAVDGEGVGGFLGSGGQAGVQQPDQGVEPEESQGQTRHKSEDPVAASDVGQFMSKNRLRRFGAAHGVLADQDDARRRTPAERSADAGRGDQAGAGRGVEAGQGFGPDAMGHGAAGLGPAIQDPYPQGEASGDQHQSGGIGEGGDQGPGQAGGRFAADGDPGDRLKVQAPGTGLGQVGGGGRVQPGQLHLGAEPEEERQGQQQADAHPQDGGALAGGTSDEQG
ncbi:hypothetical protein D3C72_1188030 [compost metagenome]